MDTLKKLFQTFAYVMAGTTISTAIFITIFVPEHKFSILLVWEIIALSAVCALGNFIYYYKEVLSKEQMKHRIICHYIYINIVVIGGGYLWGWLTPGLISEFLVMFLLVAAVYISVTITIFRQEKKTADSLNRRLRKYYPQEEEEDIK